MSVTLKGFTPTRWPYKAEKRPKTYVKRSVDIIRTYLKPVSKEALPTLQSEPNSLKRQILLEWGAVCSNLLLVGFVTFDMFGQQSIHLLQPLDDSIHSWVTGHIPIAYRNGFFGEILSNICIVSTLFAWLLLDLRNSPQNEPFYRRVISADNVKLGGCILGVELAAEAIKEYFKRPRPRSDIWGFSYPSGHTLTAVVLGGMFLFLKLRPVLVDNQSNQASGSGCDRLNVILTMTWFVCGIVTAVGRIGADAHWLTDTLTGGGLGITVVIFLRLKRRL